MINAIVGLICFVAGLFVGARNKKHRIIQIGGDNAYQVGIINNVAEDNSKGSNPTPLELDKTQI